MEEKSRFLLAQNSSGLLITIPITHFAPNSHFSFFPPTSSPFFLSQVASQFQSIQLLYFVAFDSILLPSQLPVPAAAYTAACARAKLPSSGRQAVGICPSVSHTTTTSPAAAATDAALIVASLLAQFLYFSLFFDRAMNERRNERRAISSTKPALLSSSSISIYPPTPHTSVG